MDTVVSYIDNPTRAVWSAIAEPLSRYNEMLAGQSGRHLPLVYVLRNEADAIVGGVWGRISFSFLHIEMLFIPKQQRNRGLGTRLLNMAESKAMELGCSGARVEAYSFGAPCFYERRGYHRCGEIVDLPPGYKLVFLSKFLIRPTDSTG